MGVSKESGTPKSRILIGFSIINHPFWGTPILGNTHINSSIIWGFVSLCPSFQLRSLGTCSGTYRHCGCFLVWAYELHRVSSTESLGHWWNFRYTTGKTPWFHRTVGNSSRANYCDLSRGHPKWWFTGWWFQIFFIFTPIWGRFPFWLIFFKGVETTN